MSGPDDIMGVFKLTPEKTQDAIKLAHTIIAAEAASGDWFDRLDIMPDDALLLLARAIYDLAGALRLLKAARGTG